MHRSGLRVAVHGSVRSTVGRRGWRLCEKTPKIVTLNDLRHIASLNVSYFDEGGLEGEDIRILQGCGQTSEWVNKMRARDDTNQMTADVLPSVP